MTPEQLIGLIEELIDLKIRQHLELQVKLNPELSRLARQKRDEDHHRIAQLRAELVQALSVN